MAFGLDYAFAHPDLQCAKDRGVVFVARYVGDPDPNPDKYLDAPELQRIRSKGMSVIACRETTAGFMLTDSGAAHAQASRRHLNELGMAGAVVFYALDVDPRGLTQAQRNAVAQFLADAANADGGGHNVGLYGSDDAMDWYVGQWYCHWGWQTYAWSSGRISPKAHFRQYQNGQSFCGGTVDFNETYVPDFGQWPRPSTPTEDFDLSQAQYDEIIRRFDNIQRQIVTRRPIRSTEDHPNVWAWDGLDRAHIDGDPMLNSQLTLEVLKTNPSDHYGYVVPDEVLQRIPIRLTADKVEEIVTRVVTQIVQGAITGEITVDVDYDQIRTIVQECVEECLNATTLTLQGTTGALQHHGHVDG